MSKFNKIIKLENGQYGVTIPSIGIRGYVICGSFWKALIYKLGF